MARIGLNKLVVDAVNKIKSDEKVGSWKKTFIQYKSRCEKRKSWKEKTKMLKEIEQNLKLDSNELEKLNEEFVEEKLSDDNSTDDDDDDDDDDNDDERGVENASHEDEMYETEEKNDQHTEISHLKTTRIETKNNTSQSKNTEKEKLTKKNKETLEHKLRLTKHEESEDGESSLNSFGSDDNVDDEESDDQSLNEEESAQNESESEEKFVYSSKNLENKFKHEESKFKPLVIENKPAHMVIKQICLEELKDVDEIPIQNNEPIGTSDDHIEDSENSNSVVETIKINEDPFFLDEKGNEIVNQQFDRNIQDALNDRSRRFSYYTKQDNLNSYSSYDNYRKRRNESATNFMNDRFDKKPYKPFSSYNDSNNNYKSRSDYKTRDSKGYDNKKPFLNYQSNKPFAQSNTSNKQPTEDVSKLHPSWQAKRIQEQKLKELKFEGKKITFDD